MANKLPKYRHKKLKDNFEYDVPGRKPGERKIIAGFINIDRECFKKTPEEKLKLKLAKLKSKLSADQ